jgi:hypothetical protein
MTNYESIFINQDFSFLIEDVSRPEIYLFLALFFNEISKNDHDHYLNPIMIESIMSFLEMDDEGVENWVDKPCFEPSNYFVELISKNSSLDDLNQGSFPDKRYFLEDETPHNNIENINNIEDAREFLNDLSIPAFYDNSLNHIFEKAKEIKDVLKEKLRLENTIISSNNKKGIKL